MSRRGSSGSSHRLSGDGSGFSGPSSSGPNQVLFCVNPILFGNCGLLLNYPSGLNTAAIMKLRQESGNLTSISLASWKDLAINSVGLTEAAAYSIFDVFFALSGGCMQATPSYFGTHRGAEHKSVAEYRQESNAALLQKMGGCVDEERWPVASTTRQVSLPGLTIFLLTQLLLERSPLHPLGEISQDIVVNHVQQYLHDYITAVAATRHGRVTIADALELRFLLREFVNGVEQPFGTSLGHLWQPNEKIVDIAFLSQFIRQKVVHPGDLLTGLTKAPPHFANNVVLEQLHNTIVTLSAPVIPDYASKLLSSNFTIANCIQSSIYVASALPHTRLANLSNCTIALGPVGGVLCVDRCKNCNISAFCGAIVVSNCVVVQLFICTNTPPVLIPPAAGGTPQTVRFAPYNSFYSSLEEHLSLSGISPKLNLWNAGLPSQQFILPPEDFTPVCFPVSPRVTAAMTTCTNPCSLPQPYSDALNRRLNRFQDISKDLQEAHTRLEADGRHDLAESLRGKVNHMFLEWLQQSGQAHGLIDLLHQSNQ